MLLWSSEECRRGVDYFKESRYFLDLCIELSGVAIFGSRAESVQGCVLSATAGRPSVGSRLHRLAFRGDAWALARGRVGTGEGTRPEGFFLPPVHSVLLPAACSLSTLLQAPRTEWEGHDIQPTSGVLGLYLAGCLCPDCDQRRQGDECSGYGLLAERGLTVMKPEGAEGRVASSAWLERGSPSCLCD